jgi:peptide chain release factor 2
LKEESQKKGFWDNPKEAGKIMKRKEDLEEEIRQWEDIRESGKNLADMAEELVPGDSEEISFLEESLSDILRKIGKIEKLVLYQGKYDKNDSIVTITSGAGGADAQDWAEMLLRMYLRYCEKKDYNTKIINQVKGAEGGTKSVVFLVEGNYSFGNLKNESGVHRLVRLSPFNAKNSRETSFASVEVIPVIEKREGIKLEDKDLRIDTYRSSGAGGQHVNTTDSAVRITHLPTGLAAACQSERSQLQNKERALVLLKSKIFNKLEKDKEEKKRALRGERKAVEWGSQIRSYVLHPYKMVKDHRTGYETGNAEKVLDGEIEEFIEAKLREQLLS